MYQYEACYGSFQRQNIISAKTGEDLHFFMISGFFGRSELQTFFPREKLAAANTGGHVPWHEKSFLTRRYWGEETKTLVILGEDTEQCVRWPWKLQNSFPDPVPDSNAFGMVGKACT